MYGTAIRDVDKPTTDLPLDSLWKISIRKLSKSCSYEKCIERSEFYGLVVEYRAFKFYSLFNAKGGNLKICIFQRTIMGKLL